MMPKEVFFTTGTGVAKDRLVSFELALREADIARFNLVQVSSILPPNCKIIPAKEGHKKLKSGEIVFAVMAKNDTKEADRRINASIGVAIPTEESDYGYLSEHHSFGESEETAGSYAEDLAAQMLAGTYGIDLDLQASYDERKDIYKMSGKIIDTKNYTSSAKGDPDDLWTTVVAAAVFIM